MARNQIIIVILIIVVVIAYVIANSGILDFITNGGYQGPAISPNTSPSPQELPANASMTLGGVNGSPAIGEGNRKLIDGIYNIGLRVEKLSPPPQKVSYRVWLIQKAGIYDDAISLDALKPAGSGPYKGDYVLGAQMKEDIRMFEAMIVTLQPMTDKKPSNIILEGTFR